jgi:hypothetical protein
MREHSDVGDVLYAVGNGSKQVSKVIRNQPLR